MDTFFKKFTTALLMMGIASTACAAAGNANSAGIFRVNGVFFGVDALSLQPRNDDLDYVTVFPDTSTGSVSTKAIPTSYDWGFNLFAGIKFGNNNDLTLDWWRLHTNDSSSIPNQTESLVSMLVWQTQPRWLFTDTWQDINAKVDFKLDDVSLVLGHTVNFNNPWSLRFGGGLEYAQLDSDMQVLATYVVPSAFGSTYGFESENDFKGIGPRVESNLIYHLPYNFALFVDGDAALLIGRRDLGFDSLRTQGGASTVNGFPSINFTTPHIVVPHLGMRIGVSYSYYFSQAGGDYSCNVLGLEAGWQADTFINAIERVEQNTVSELPQLVGGISSSSVTTKVSSFSDQGLFFGVNFSSNWL
jgi:hypothetical protein